MIPASLLTALLFAAASAPAAPAPRPAAPPSLGTREAAEAAVENACKAGDCAAAREVLERVVSGVGTLARCGRACGRALRARVQVQFEEARSRAAALDSTKSDLLAVFSYARRTAEEHGTKWAFTSEELAEGEVAWVCAEKRDACPLLTRSRDSARLLETQAASCTAKGCDAADLLAICRGIQDAHYYRNQGASEESLEGRFVIAWVAELVEKVNPGAAPRILGDLDEAEKQAKSATDAISGLDAACSADQLAAATVRLEAARARWQGVSRLVNLCQGDTPNLERLNGVARGLATSRAKLQALRVAKGLSAPVQSGPEPLVITASASGRDPVAPAPAAARRRPARPDALAASGLLDAPPVVIEPPSLAEPQGLLDRLFGPEPTELQVIQAKRENGEARLLGDPVGRAALVHAQTDQTCAVVSQQQVLSLLNLTGRGSENEKTLAKEAESKGYYYAGWGTPNHLVGGLMADRGVLVARTVGNKPEYLEAVARTGRPFIAGVDARRLWGVPARATLGHAVLVTGALEDAKTGKILGYYLNDSGTNPPGKARFVLAGEFVKMWNDHGSRVVEVL